MFFDSGFIGFFLFFVVQVCEKEKLLLERNQLKACMGELLDNFFCFFQEVCRDIQSFEQIQVLYRYCFVFRFMGFFIVFSINFAFLGVEQNFVVFQCAVGDSVFCCLEQGVVFFGSFWVFSNVLENCIFGRRLEGFDFGIFLERGFFFEFRSQIVIVDFCQEMIDKCIIDEQFRKDYIQ